MEVNNNSKENQFEIVKKLRIDLNNIFDEIDIKLKALNHIYEDLVKTHQDKNYILGMDSFHFQNKLIQMEYDNMKQIYNFIDNRIYCEYYKLHKMLFDFITKEIKEKIIIDKLLITHKKYPVYKDLEPTKIYDFNIASEINNTILNIIKELKSYIEEQRVELNEKINQSNMGLNIQSIIHEQSFNITILEERINMFENYLNTFCSHHSKYFTRLTIKLKLMLGIVNEDFHLKKSKSLHLKTTTNKSKLQNNENLTLEASNSLQRVTRFTDNIDNNSLSSNCSNGSSEVTTPITSMNDDEESNVRKLIGITDSNKDVVESELNTILQHIPESDAVESGTRRTIKKQNIIM